jgi:hypothetical protein
MKLQKYKIVKIQDYLKNKFFFFTGVNKNSNDSVLVEQDLKNISFHYYKNFYKTKKKPLKNLVYKAIKFTLYIMTFIIKRSATMITRTITQKIIGES